MIAGIEYDKDKVDEGRCLNSSFLLSVAADRAWKGHDRDALGRLHEKVLMILDPVGKRNRSC